MSNFINLLDIIYPVGSVYITFNETSPTDVIGGTWELLENTFLYSSSGTIGEKGGESTHTLISDEIPEHAHAIRVAVVWGGNAAAYRSVCTTNSPFWGGDIDGTYDSNNITSYIGANKPHNNMPPYITVHMYRRTA